MRFIACLVSLASFIAATGSLAAQSDPVSLPTNAALIDCAWDYRLASVPMEKRFALIERAYEKNPSDNAIKSSYAEYLVMGKSWGGPDGRAPEGLALAQKAADDGNTIAVRVLALAKAHGIGSDKNLRLAAALFDQSARDGNINSMVILGNVYLDERNLGEKISMSETWFRVAAKRGRPEHLYKLALIYEKNRQGNVISLPKAAALMYEAAHYGSVEAFKHMKQVLKDKDAAPEMRRAACLTMLWYGALGHTSLQTSRVKDAARELETLYPNDLEALVSLGRMYRSDEFGMRDMKKAFGFFDKAAALGSDDGLCERAVMQAEGAGVPADPVAAVAAWRELEKKGHPGALASLGYYSYWGSLKHDGLPKDEKLAYGYSRMAAAAGDLFGQFNATSCFTHGIGTEKNYLLAITYSHAAAQRGNKAAQKELPKLISAAFD